MKNRINNNPLIENNVTEHFPVVAIGASAGGLDALIQFFTSIPVKNNMAFVVITHLDPTHKSILCELIQAHTSMPVTVIEQGVILLPNTIYIIPPQKNVMIQNDAFLLVAQAKPHYANLPINYFFHSLAVAYGKQAIGIILSGCGMDGSLGINEIKQNGGIVIVQDPETSQYNSMPNNAIHTGLVDQIATPEKIFHHIKRLRNLNHNTSSNMKDEMLKIFSILRTATGNDFAGYKTSVLKRRIERQMKRLHISVLSDYVNYLNLNSNEAKYLFTDLLIGVTSFFRDADAFVTLKNSIFPQLLKNKPNHYSFRAWVPGCSTGKEAYSLAILLREYMNETNRFFHVQIFATDIDENALEIARSGVYRNTITNELSPERLNTFFIKDKDTYRVKKEIREMIVFGIQNIIQDPPFTKLDLISCRNLLIYLNTASQRRLFPLFHYSLKPKGVLFLGKSESANHYMDLFLPIGTLYRFFEKTESSSSGYLYSDRPINQNLLKWSSFLPGEKFVANNNLDLDYILKEILIDQYILPCLIVDSKGEILFSHGNLATYLSSNVQLIHSNILDVIRPHIKAILKPFFFRTGMHQIEKSITKTLVDPFSNSCVTNLLMSPIHKAADVQGLILIRFEIIQLHKMSSKNTFKIDKHLFDVEEELNITKENLQITIEDLEASNEEMQSTNEEFQSINEELETSKEELESVNEELLIVNAELQTRFEQLAAVNDDMNNLFNSTAISAIFLDNSLLIKRFTPQVQELLHLIPTDIGRSFGHFSTNIKGNHLVESSIEVLKTLQSKIFEVQSNNNRWYLVNILPYRTLMDIVDGVVITFADITQNKLDKEEIIKLRTQLNEKK